MSRRTPGPGATAAGLDPEPTAPPSGTGRRRATLGHLMKARDTHQEIDLPDGTTVEIRGLTRKEMAGVQEMPTNAAAEAYILHKGMVDPAMTLEQAMAWQETEGAADNVDTVAHAIDRATGRFDGAGKEAAKSAP